MWNVKLNVNFGKICAVTIILSAFFSTNSFAQTKADAQKAYVAGKWKEAAAAYEVACPKEPDSLKAECYLWNVLALSQTGNAQSFKIAGKRLDSLIQTTNPQKSIYADLLMTSAQFRLYMGKYDLAAEDLVRAIETSHPNQAPVLQKVCSAVQAKTKKENLNEACAKLSQTDSIVTEKAQPPAAVQPVQEVKPAPAKPESSSAAVSANQGGNWYLQLGAFGVKANAEFLVNNLKKRGITCSIEERVGETKTLYLVQSGNFETKEKAIDFGAEKLTPLNIEFRAYSRK